jgi:amidohydrolase
MVPIRRDTAKDMAAQRITGCTGDLVALSHRIHAHPETAFEEHQAVRWCVQTLADAGLHAVVGAYGLPTAFEATIGTGPLTVAICCEYDALPEIGHACGHNVIAAAGVGAAIGLSSVADDVGVRVKVLGTPAEETGGGKALLLDNGAFDDVGAAMMVHPGGVDAVQCTSFARSSLAVEYYGRAAHATAAPHHGRNAADAMTVAQVAIGLLRQQLPVDCRVHGVTVHAGDAPNVIPARATANYSVRAGTVEELRVVRARVADCFMAGALATGCHVELTTPEPDYLDFRTDAGLASHFDANVRALGRRPVIVAAAASTDMANVSHAVPAIHPTLDIGSHGTYPHQPEFAAHCATPAADRAILDGATAMAWTAIDFAFDACR